MQQTVSERTLTIAAQHYVAAHQIGAVQHWHGGFLCGATPQTGPVGEGAAGPHTDRQFGKIPIFCIIFSQYEKYREKIGTAGRGGRGLAGVVSIYPCHLSL